MKKILIIQTPHYDFTSSNLIEGLHHLIVRRNADIEFFTTEESNYSYAYDKGLLNNYTMREEEVVDYGQQEADIIVLTSNREVKLHLVNKINRPEKMVYLDGLDEYNLADYPSKYVCYFKREFMVGTIYEENKTNNMIPFPFGIENRYFTKFVDGDNLAIHELDVSKLKFPKEKDIIFSCMFGKTDDMKPWRTWISETIQGMQLKDSITKPTYGSEGIYKKKFYIKTGGRYHYNYYETLYNTKVSVDGYGAHGASTSRFWESLANGCLVLSQPVRYAWPEGSELIEDEDYVAFADSDELIDKVKMLEENLDLVDKIAMSGFKKIKKYHTNKARAKFFLEECERFGL